MDLLVAYVPCPSAEEAERIGKALVGQRLVACANWFSLRSCYRWEGVVKVEEEWLLLAKTLPSQKDAVVTAIEGMHLYDVPCVLFLDGEVNERYGRWVQGELQDIDA